MVFYTYKNIILRKDDAINYKDIIIKAFCLELLLRLQKLMQ